MSIPSWTPMNKSLAAYFKKIRRPYSEIEAHFSLSLDVNCNKVRSIRSYARMWDWSVPRASRFIKISGFELDKNVTPALHLRYTNVTPMCVIDLNIQDKTLHKRDTSVTPALHKYKEQRTKKNIKDKTYRPEFITEGNWTALIEHRKKHPKKPTHSERSCLILANKIKKCIEAGYDQIFIIDTIIGRNWQTVELEWLNNIKKGNGNGRQKTHAQEQAAKRATAARWLLQQKASDEGTGSTDTAQLLSPFQGPGD